MMDRAIDLKALYEECERLDIDLPFSVVVDSEWNCVRALCKGCGLSIDGLGAAEIILNHYNDVHKGNPEQDLTLSPPWPAKGE